MNERDSYLQKVNVAITAMSNLLKEGDGLSQWEREHINRALRDLRTAWASLGGVSDSHVTRRGLYLRVDKYVIDGYYVLGWYNPESDKFELYLGDDYPYDNHVNVTYFEFDVSATAAAPMCAKNHLGEYLFSSEPEAKRALNAANRALFNCCDRE